MAKVARKIKTKQGLRLKIVNPDAAGIDVADGEMQVCVPEDRDGENNRRFDSFTCDLREICAWLKACRITTVAMESTGVYWLNIFLMLQQEGFDVVLANPLQVKNLMDEKTDEADAEWLMLLHSYGMVKPCFQPDNVARQIRNLTRHRSTLITTAGREVQHMQKAMEQMNIKLSTVITDILGKSGMAIIRAIIDGNHNPNSLAQLADGRCRASKDTIAKSLDGTWDDDLLFVLKQSVELYDYYQKKVAECEREIERLMIRYSAQVDVEGAGKLSRSEKHTTYKNAPDIDVEKYGHALWESISWRCREWEPVQFCSLSENSDMISSASSIHVRSSASGAISRLTTKSREASSYQVTSHGGRILSDKYSDNVPTP